MKIPLVGRGSISPEKIASNIAHTKSLGLPSLDLAKVHSFPVALIGGGPSINSKIEEIRNWPGEVWAVNGARAWCDSHGIESTFVSCDTSPILAGLAKGSKRALLASTCDPSVFDALKGADVRVFDVGLGEIACGPTTATAVPMLSTKCGHPGAVFFGCEGSWDYQTHAYPQDCEDQSLIDWKMLVECGGKEFLTCAEYLMQAEYLSEIIRLAPDVFRQRGGGLLEQMVKTPDWNIAAVSRKLLATNGYDENLKKIA